MIMQEIRASNITLSRSGILAVTGGYMEKYRTIHKGSTVTSCLKCKERVGSWKIDHTKSNSKEWDHFILYQSQESSHPLGNGLTAPPPLGLCPYLSSFWQTIYVNMHAIQMLSKDNRAYSYQLLKNLQCCCYSKLFDRCEIWNEQQNECNC